MPDARHKELKTIPGVGPSMARDLVDLGIEAVSWTSGSKPSRSSAVRTLIGCMETCANCAASAWTRA